MLELLICGKTVLVDDEDYPTLIKYNWKIYSSSHGYAERCVSGTKSLMHREIMGNPSGMIVDHINGNKLDNRKCNLRVCSQSENLKHRNNTPSNNTSGHIGVSWDESRGKWRSYIKIGKSVKSLGRFKSIDDAIKTRVEFERLHYGEYSPIRK